MIIQEIYGSILCIINDFDIETYNWIKMKRLNKPKGVLNYMVNYLKQFEDYTIILKLQKFSENIDNIHTIIFSETCDITKKNKLINLMEGKLNSIYPEKNNEPIDCEFYDTKINNWLGI